MSSNANLSDYTSKQAENRQGSLLKNISQLQQTETDLYTQLENASAVNDTDKQESIVNKINEMSTIRLSLFKELDSMYKSLQGRVSQSRNDLVDQLTVTGVMEKELNNAKVTLNALRKDKDNKMRMVEINTYYASKYKSQSNLMKLIVVLCIPLLVISILTKKQIIPSKIGLSLAGIIIVVGLVLVVKRLYDILRRNNMNYDEYEWLWDPDALDPTVYEYDKEQLEKITANIDASLNIGCIGSECCSVGTKYDTSTQRCVLSKESFTGLKDTSYMEVAGVPFPNRSSSVVQPYDTQTSYVSVS
uniref:Uncharacterized protein n=1 Tax=viral metagenome TaxID=1070528 RepID=A0A6C0JXN9_9ZZZZ